MRLCPRLWMLLLALFVAVGCGPVPPPQDAYQDAATLLSALKEKRSAVGTLRASGRVDHFGEGQRVQGKVYVFARLPDAIRVDLVSPLGSSLAVLAAEGGQFAMHDVRQGRFLRGPADPCNIARLVQIPLPVADVARILVGSSPIIDGAPSLRWDKRAGAYELTLTDGVLEQRLLVAPDKRTLPLLRSTLRRSGNVVFDISFDRWSPVGAVAMALEIRVKMPGSQSDLLLRYDHDGIEVDIDLPNDAFHLAPPSGMKVEDVTCDGP